MGDTPMGDKAADSDEVRRIRALATAARGNPRALITLAERAAAAKQHDLANELADAAQADAPDSREVTARARQIITARIPRYHIAMLRDEPRNRAFEEAIVAAVTPDSRVLDIGAGSGLLAMIAARAGAASVTTCEMVDAVAKTSQAIIAANGMADRINLVARRSTELDPNRDMGGRADIIIAEVIGHNLLDEGVLATLGDAAQRLLAPGGRMIPAGGAMMVAPARWDGLGERFIGTINGFDLSGFNALVRMPLGLAADAPGLSLAGPAAALFSFDFAKGEKLASHQATVRLTVDDAQANGVIEWIRLELDDKIAYENRPGIGQKSHWGVRFHPLPRPATTGETIILSGRHDRRTSTLWVEGIES